MTDKPNADSARNDALDRAEKKLDQIEANLSDTQSGEAAVVQDAPAAEPQAQPATAHAHDDYDDDGRGGGGFLWGLGGALIGGAAALFGAPYLSGVTGVATSTQIESQKADTQAEFQALRDEIRAVSMQPMTPPDVSDALTVVKSLQSDVAVAQTAIAQLREQVDGLLNAPATEGEAAAAPQIDLSPLSDRIAALEAEIAARAAVPAMAAQTAEAQAEIAETPDQTAEAAAPAAPLAVAAGSGLGVQRALDAIDVANKRLNGLGATVQDLGERLAAAEATLAPLGALPETVTTLVADGAKAQIAALTPRLDELAAAAAAPLPRLDAVEARIGDVEKKAETMAADGRSAALGVAFADLANAVASSRPYEAELTQVETLAGATAPEALRIYAATGTPTVPQLLRSLPTVAAAGIAAENHAAGAKSDSIADKLSGALSSFVVTQRVASYDDPQDRSSDAIFSRIRFALDEGDGALALQEAETLPDAAMAAASDWIDGLRSRVNADESLKALRAATLGRAAGQ